MTSESGGRPEVEQFPCPRCDSTNTKFCYYNNYNLSQPRHFCKSCRRYWTRGGALRNVPVGGGTRKAHSSNKRPRLAPSTPPRASASSGTGQTQIVNPVTTGSGSGSPAAVNLPDSWWGGQMGANDGLFPMNGYGAGVGAGLGYGLGMLEWPMEHLGGENGGSVPESAGGTTSQMGAAVDNDGGGEADGDYFSWPELAIPTPGNALK